MTQDLFVSPSLEEQELMSAPIPRGTHWGIDWFNLKQMWLAALENRSIPLTGWAMFMCVDTCHPRFAKGRREFDLFLLNQGQHPVWWSNCTYFSALSSHECNGWEEFSSQLDTFYREQPNDLPFGFDNDGEWFVDCMVRRIALETLREVNWKPSSPVGSHFLSANTGQDILLRPLHPSGGHLFVATRGSTYEEAVNFSIMYSHKITMQDSATD